MFEGGEMTAEDITWLGNQVRPLNEIVARDTAFEEQSEDGRHAYERTKVKSLLGK